MKKKTRMIIIGAMALLVIIVLAINLFTHKRRYENPIDKATASRMLCLLVDDVTYDANEWYVKYLNKLSNDYELNWFHKDVDYGIVAGEALTYGDLKKVLNKLNLNISDIESFAKLKINKQGKNKKVDRDDFDSIYDYLVLIYSEQNNIVRKEITVVATPTYMNKEEQKRYGNWKLVSDSFIYNFEGLDMDQYVDKTVCVYIKADKIIKVVMPITDEVIYKNALISVDNNKVRAYINGATREFAANIAVDEHGQVADLYLKNGQLSSITIKKDMIRGKVIRASREAIEIEGYGRVLLEDGYKIYDNVTSPALGDITDIIVGYDVADYVVADGKICAAIISRKLVAKNIRVLIMNTNFETIFHDRVSLSSEYGFTIYKGDEVIDIEAEALVDIYPDSELMSEGRIIVAPKGASDTISIMSIERSYGNPAYEGIFEITNENGRLLIVNELSLEKYLYRVVPSEMPVKFGVEALKVQAVCARSYAYKHITDNSYRIYGAHVDDSVSYQVYNNIKPQPNSTQAVKETYGQVICEDRDVVTAYYYSTSCGHTSDTTLWGGADEYGMYKAKCVNEDGTYTDLDDEDAFREFITSKNEKDYDYEFPYYRWDVTLDIDYLSSHVNEVLKNRFAQDNYSILTMVDGNWQSVKDPDVGKITGIEIAKRSTGGAIKELVIRGDNKDVLVLGELNIRYVLGPGDVMLNTNDGTQTTFYILPSAYMYPEGLYENGVLRGYRFVGGGYGHGIGMSQNAVSAMVKSGLRYDEILEFFYENVDIMNIYE